MFLLIFLSLHTNFQEEKRFKLLLISEAHMRDFTLESFVGL